jgi:ADP-ribosylglycohydrolase
MNDGQALLYGLTLGSAFGAHTKRNGYKYDVAQRIVEFPESVEFTNNMQLSLTLTVALLEAAPQSSVEQLMQIVGTRFVQWWQHSPSDQITVEACRQAIERFQGGINWRESGSNERNGGCAVVRAATIGLLCRDDLETLVRVAEATCMITHGHPTSLAASVATAYLVSLVLRGAHTSEYLRRLMMFTQGMSDDLDAALYRVGHCLTWTDEMAALKHIGDGNLAEEVVAQALYCVLRYPDDYVVCLRRAANTEGDSESIASIAGGIMGVRVGLSGIPSSWRARCENAVYFDALGLRLTSARLTVQ